MKKSVALFAAALCFFFASCHRPTALFQRTPHAVSRMSAEPPIPGALVPTTNSLPNVNRSIAGITAPNQPVANLKNQPAIGKLANARVHQRMHRIQSVLAPASETIDKQPRPKPKPKNKLRLGNRIRQELGIPLRQELTWWQRISWKIKASVIVILVAVVFAILHISVLAIIFGLLGAFLLITGLKRSFKTRRPWF